MRTRILLVLICGLSVVASWPASCSAQDPATWVQESLLADCKAWGNCWRKYGEQRRYPRWHEREERFREYRREEHVEDYREPERFEPVRYYDRHERERQGFNCKTVVISVVSTEHQTEEEARDAAARLWAVQVSWTIGAQWMNLNNAARYRERCDMSNAGDTMSGKLGQGTAAIAEIIPFTKQHRAAQQGQERGLRRCYVEAIPCRKPLMDREDRADENERRDNKVRMDRVRR